jgi:hypothetical protein
MVMVQVQEMRALVVAPEPVVVEEVAVVAEEVVVEGEVAVVAEMVKTMEILLAAVLNLPTRRIVVVMRVWLSLATLSLIAQ